MGYGPGGHKESDSTEPLSTTQHVDHMGEFVILAVVMLAMILPVRVGSISFHFTV